MNRWAKFFLIYLGLGIFSMLLFNPLAEIMGWEKYGRRIGFLLILCGLIAAYFSKVFDRGDDGR